MSTSTTEQILVVGVQETVGAVRKRLRQPGRETMVACRSAGPDLVVYLLERRRLLAILDGVPDATLLGEALKRARLRPAICTRVGEVPPRAVYPVLLVDGDKILGAQNRPRVKVSAVQSRSPLGGDGSRRDRSTGSGPVGYAPGGPGGVGVGPAPPIAVMPRVGQERFVAALRSGPARHMVTARRPAPGLYPPGRVIIEEPASSAAPEAGRSDLGDTFSAYPAMTMPDQLFVGEPFTLKIDLAPVQAEGTEGDPITVENLPQTLAELPFEVRVLATAMKVIDGKGWVRPLTVDRRTGKTEPVRMRLQVTEEAQAGKKLTVRVHYSYEGQWVGSGYRNVEIVAAPPGVELAEEMPAAAELAAAVMTSGQPAAAPELPGPERRGVTGVVSGALVRHPVDMTLVVQQAEVEADGFYFYVETPHAGLNQAWEPRLGPVHGGSDAGTFARWLMSQVDSNSLDDTTDLTLGGQGAIIARLVPDEVWATIRAVARQVEEKEHRPATLLIRSSEFHVPWELAQFSVYDPGAGEAAPQGNRPPFLGAQVAVGRWYQPLDANPQEERLLADLPARQRVDAMTVVWSTYENGRATPLPEAAREQELLHRGYSAQPVAARQEEVYPLLRRGPLSGVLHFACHGLTDYVRGQTGLQLEDPPDLTPDKVLALRTTFESTRPFIFMNACQVGQSLELSVGTLGMTDSFLRVGASGCIAPLWSVYDETALAIVRDFYQLTLEKHEPVGQVLMELRSRFLQQGPPYDATFLAYVYYGHPGLVLERKEGV